MDWFNSEYYHILYRNRDNKEAETFINNIIKKLDTSIIKKVTTFDIFEGQNISEGKKSVAINVVIQAPDKTLTEEDLDMISQKIIKSVKEKTGATIRS